MRCWSAGRSVGRIVKFARSRAGGRICLNSARSMRFCSTHNRNLAEKIRQKIEYENATGDLETATRTRLDCLLTSFVEHLKTRLPAKSVANDVSRLRRLFGPIVPLLETKPPVKSSKDSPLAILYVEQITPQLINQRLDQRAREVSPKTVNEEREILHRLFSYAIDFHGMVHRDRRHANPAAAVSRALWIVKS